nr:MAG TPA: hypothetical protein [Caudoviricetes sp.]
MPANCWNDCFRMVTWLCHVNYVIVKAFYPLLLMVSHKFGVHFQPLVCGCRILLGMLYSTLFP